MDEQLTTNLINLIASRVDLIYLVLIISGFLNLVCLIICSMVFWTQRKRINAQAELLKSIKPAVQATVRNRNDILRLAEVVKLAPPDKVRQMLSERIDYYGKLHLQEMKICGDKILKNISTELFNGIYVRMDRRKGIKK